MEAQDGEFTVLGRMEQSGRIAIGMEAAGHGGAAGALDAEALRSDGVSPQDDVAAVLPPHGEAQLLERPDHIGTGDLRQLAHTASRSASKCSSGTGRPSSFSAST